MDISVSKSDRMKGHPACKVNFCQTKLLTLQSRYTVRYQGCNFSTATVQEPIIQLWELHSPHCLSTPHPEFFCQRYPFKYAQNPQRRARPPKSLNRPTIISVLQTVRTASASLDFFCLADQYSGYHTLLQCILLVKSTAVWPVDTFWCNRMHLLLVKVT